MKYDTVFPAFADRMVSRLAAIGAVGAAAAFLKWEWTVAAGFAAGVVIHILFLVHETALHPLGERKAGRGLHRPDGRRACRLPAFVEAGLAAAVVLWTPLSILGFLAGLLSLFPATIWARQ